MYNLGHGNVKLCKVILSCVKHAKCLSVNFNKRYIYTILHIMQNHVKQYKRIKEHNIQYHIMQYCNSFVFKVQDNTYGNGVGLTKKEGKKKERGKGQNGRLQERKGRKVRKNKRLGMKNDILQNFFHCGFVSSLMLLPYFQRLFVSATSGVVVI